MNSGEYIVYPDEYDDIDYLKEGRAKVKQDGKYGFINEQGEEVVEPKHDYVTDFEKDFAATKNEDQVIIIDKNGNKVIDPREIDIETDLLDLHYFEDPGVYRINDLYYIDQDGWVRKPIY